MKQYADAVIALADRNNGKLTPELVVRAAQAKSSPLHDYFDWDDKIAGARWRLEQARELIRSVKIDITTSTVTIPAPLFIRDPNMSSDDQGYMSVVRLRSDQQMAREAVVAEFDRAGAALARAKAVAAALNLENEVEQLYQQVTKLADKVRKEERTST